MVVNKRNGQSTTLACARIFQNKAGGYQFIGFGVGDCLIASWNPELNECVTLINGIGAGSSPAPINAFNREELQIVRAEITENTIIMAMSDGVYESLSLNCSFENSKGAVFIKHQLNPNLIKNIFSQISETSIISDFSNALISENAKNIEQLKQDLTVDLQKNGCAIVFVTKKPTLNLEELPAQFNKFYIRYKNELYFADRKTNQFILLISETEKAIISRLDEALKLNPVNESSRILSSDELKIIYSIIRHNPDIPAYGDDTTLVIARISQPAFNQALNIKKQLDSLLFDAQQLAIDYSKTKASNDYDMAKRKFFAADSLFTIDNDFLGKCRCLVGLGNLTLALYKAQTVLPGMEFYDYRNRCIDYALSIKDEIKNINIEMLEKNNSRSEFFNETKQYLNATKKLVSQIPAREWNVKESKEEASVVIAEILESLNKLSTSCSNDDSKGSCLMM